jgi:tetratricopeptide (TPR) repeat protein
MMIDPKLKTDELESRKSVLLGRGFGWWPVFLVLLVGLACPGEVTACAKKKAREHYENSEYDQAIQRLSKRIKRRPKDYEAHRILGHCYMQKEDYTRAINAYLEANKEKPPNPDTHRYLGRAYLKRGHFGSARDMFDFVLMDNPRDLEARLTMGFCYLNLQKYDESVAQYEVALQIDANASVAMINLARIHDQIKQDYPAALFYYERFLEADADSNLAAEAREKVQQLRTTIQRRALAGLDETDPGAGQPPGRSRQGGPRPDLPATGLFAGGKRGLLLTIRGEQEESYRETITDYARTAVFERLGLVLVPPEDWRAAWESLVGREGGPCYRSECLVGLGRTLGVDKVMTGKVQSMGITQLVVLELYDVAGGGLQAVASYPSNPADTTLLQAIDRAVSELGRSLLRGE